MKLDKMTLEQLVDERDKAKRRAVIGTLTGLGGLGGGYAAGKISDIVDNENLLLLAGLGMTLGTGSALYAGYQDNKADKLSDRITKKEIQDGVIYFPSKDKHKSGEYINMKDVPKTVYATTGEATRRTLPESYLLWKEQQDYLKDVDSSIDRSKMTLEELENLKKKHMRKLRTGKLMNVVGGLTAGAGYSGAKDIIQPRGHKVLTSKPGEIPKGIGKRSAASMGALIGGLGLSGTAMVKNALNRSAIKKDNLAIEVLKSKLAENNPEVDFENLV